MYSSNIAKSVVILVYGANLFLSGKRSENEIWLPELPSLLLPHVDGEINPVHKTHYFTSVNGKNEGQQRALNSSIRKKDRKKIPKQD